MEQNINLLVQFIKAFNQFKENPTYDVPTIRYLLDTRGKVRFTINEKQETSLGEGICLDERDNLTSEVVATPLYATLVRIEQPFIVEFAMCLCHGEKFLNVEVKDEDGKTISIGTKCSKA